MKDPRDIILRPIVSEKSYSLIDKGTYTFEVHPDASKPEIGDAVESMTHFLRPDVYKLSVTADLATLVPEQARRNAPPTQGDKHP